MSKKKKTGKRRNKGHRHHVPQDKKLPSLMEFVRAHAPNPEGKELSDEELERVPLASLFSEAREVAQNTPSPPPGEDSLRRSFFDNVEKVLEWNMANPSALLDASRFMSKESQKIAKRIASRIREEGPFDSDMIVVLQMQGLLSAFDEVLPQQVWDRVTDRHAENELADKDRWEGITIEEVGCFTPFLVVNYILYQYCYAVHQRARDIDDAYTDNPNSLYVELLERGAVYVITLAMESVTGASVNIHSIQYAADEKESQKRAELIFHRIKEQKEFVGGRVSKTELLSDRCEVEEVDGKWEASFSSATGRGGTKAEAIHQLELLTLARLIKKEVQQVDPDAS